MHSMQVARAPAQDRLRHGNPAAKLVFVGEGPGADEDAQGLPFVGRAGKLLNQMIEAMGLKREDVYICNVVKCRPPENRAPEKDEVATCSPYLIRQIDAIRPQVIVCLGSVSRRKRCFPRIKASRDFAANGWSSAGRACWRHTIQLTCSAIRRRSPKSGKTCKR
jgi:uracil-DNA glycosylase family 4